jgi:hypothetical protein
MSYIPVSIISDLAVVNNSIAYVDLFSFFKKKNIKAQLALTDFNWILVPTESGGLQTYNPSFKLWVGVSLFLAKLT